MRFITAFFMAWGNFITLPCPYKKWDDKLKNLMLSMLPSVGAVVGVIFLALMWGMQKVSLPPMLMTVAAEFYMFYIHGFMHLDGFMDCTDAIMSRRPLEDRQRIMKDSNVGAFAVVMTVFVLLTWFAAFYTAITEYPFVYVAMALIPVYSRGSAGNDVLTYKPIGHSQYVEDFKEPGRLKYRVASYIQTYSYLAVLTGTVVFIFTPGVYKLGILLSAPIGTLIGQSVSSVLARRSLGGMSGDIAGYSIVWGELTGVICCALAATYF